MKHRRKGETDYWEMDGGPGWDDLESWSRVHKQPEAPEDLSMRNHVISAMVHKVAWASTSGVDETRKGSSLRNQR